MNGTSRLCARLLAVASVVTVVGSGCGGADQLSDDRRCYPAYPTEQCLGSSHPLVPSLVRPHDPDTEVLDGPYRGGQSGSDCCYRVKAHPVYGGRPLPVDDALVVAPLRRAVGDGS